MDEANDINENGGNQDNLRNQLAGEEQVGQVRPIAEPCPRCTSQDTKFCYYNNYSLTQPRHYCRTCMRHWTQGGAIRNVPIGGQRSRNRRRAARVIAPYLNPAAAPRETRGRGSRAARGGSIAMSGGRSNNMAVAGRGHGRIISNYGNPDLEARFSAYRRSFSSFAPMPLLSASGFGNFTFRPQISGAGGAWQQESLFMRSNPPNDRMFLWGLDGGASRSGTSGGDGISGLPALDDIDVIDTNQWADFLENSPPPPLTSV